MKIAIYTAIFGDKDEIREPYNFKKSSNIDYFLITDNVNIESINYKIIVKKTIIKDVTKNARNFKVNGLDEFKEYDYLIWHDANIQIVDSKVHSLITLIGNKEIALFKHPERNCIYDEAVKCIELDKDYSFKVLKQIYFYYLKGIKNNSGLYATGIIIFNKKFISNDFLQFWWHEIEHKSRRDQLSLPYSIMLFDVDPKIINDDIRKNEYSIFRPHKHKFYSFLTDNQPKLSSVFSKKLAITIIHFLIRLNKVKK